jgi:hypothetical protein
VDTSSGDGGASTGTAGFVGVGGTPPSGASGSAGSSLTHDDSGGSAGSVNEPRCVVRILPFDGDDANDGTAPSRSSCRS